MRIISLSCDHWFHVSCIRTWARDTPHQQQCPICYSEAQPDKHIIDQDLRDMGLSDWIPAPPPTPAVQPGLMRPSEDELTYINDEFPPHYWDSASQEDRNEMLRYAREAIARREAGAALPGITLVSDSSDDGDTVPGTPDDGDTVPGTPYH